MINNLYDELLFLYFSNYKFKCKGSENFCKSKEKNYIF